MKPLPFPYNVFLSLGDRPKPAPTSPTVATICGKMHYAKGSLRVQHQLTPDEQEAFEREVERLNLHRVEAIHRAHVAHDEALRELFLRAAPKPAPLQLTQKEEMTRAE